MPSVCNKLAEILELSIKINLSLKHRSFKILFTCLMVSFFALFLSGKREEMRIVFTPSELHFLPTLMMSVTIFGSFKRERILGNIITSNNQIEGFSLIKIEDQERINKVILEIKPISEKIISNTNKINNRTDKHMINITTKNKTENRQ